MKLKQKSTNQNRVKNKGNSIIVTFFKRVLFVFLAFVAFLTTLYFFVFPSILSRDNQSKNILIVSNRLDLPSNSIYLAHISGSQTKNRIVSIPSQQSVVVPGGYGEYPLQSIYQLLLIDKKDDQFILAVFSELLGVSVDEVVTLAEQLNEINEDEFPRLFLNEALTDVTKLKLHYELKDVTLKRLHNLEEFKDSNSEYKTISGDLYQHCSVAVVNATGENGVARQVGNILENTGALVVRVGDSSNHEEHTTFYISSGLVNCEELAHSISGIFKQKPKILPIEKLENGQQYRSQVVVIIGKTQL